MARDESDFRLTVLVILDLGESHHLMAEICLRSISSSEVQLDQAILFSDLNI